MSRTRLPLALAAGLAAAGPAAAQQVVPQIITPPPAVGQLVTPASPNFVRPGATIPGYGFALPGYGGYYLYPSYFGYGYPGTYYGPGAYGATPFYGYNQPFSAYTGPSPVEPPPVIVPNVEAAGTGPGRLSSPVSGDDPARLTIVLPAAGELWVDGAKQKGPATEFAITSPPLTRGRTHRFDVRARWAVGDKRYEDSRAITVESGERAKLTIVSGDVVPAK